MDELIISSKKAFQLDLRKQRWLIIKIVTINCPEPFINAIDKLTGSNGLYPSRSELIRVAVRDFLLKELRMARNLSIYQMKPVEEEFDPETMVKVPNGDDLGVDMDGGFKTFRIVKK